MKGDQEIKAIFDSMEGCERIICEQRRLAETEFKTMRDDLVGRRVKNYRGDTYEIRHIYTDFNGALHARGPKVLKSTGKLGSNTWDIGRVRFKDLQPREGAQ
jgi:hypothetical protein